ncbi:MAG: CBS domain-containing protein [Polyangia bacterium]
MKVKDILSGQAVVSVQDDDSLGLATQIMLWAGVHHLPVMDASKRLVGLLEERDILACRAREGTAADLRLVRSAMAAAPATIAPDEEVAAAAQRMLGRDASCLVVLAAGHVVGVLTTTDLLRHEAEAEAEAEPAPAASASSVADIMQTPVITAAADDYLMDALARMAERNIRHLPVVAGDLKVVGILSDRDIRTAIGDPGRAVQIEQSRVRLQSLRVADAMSRSVLTVTAHAPLSEAAARFLDHRIGALPVVDDEDRLVGIVSYLDLLRFASFQHGKTDGTRRAALRPTRVVSESW